MRAAHDEERNESEGSARTITISIGSSKTSKREYRWQTKKVLGLLLILLQATKLSRGMVSNLWRCHDFAASHVALRLSHLSYRECREVQKISVQTYVKENC